MISCHSSCYAELGLSMHLAENRAVADWDIKIRNPVWVAAVFPPSAVNGQLYNPFRVSQQETTICELS
jgi:hypothetical protein